MIDMVELLQYPFVQRALVSGILVSLVTSWIGILVVLRKASFYGDAVAHASLTGIALGLLVGMEPMLAALIYALGVGLLLPVLERKSSLSVDSLLGLLLPFSMGLAVLVLAMLPGYRPELMGYLFGGILGVSWVEFLVLIVASVVMLGLLFYFRKQLLFVSFDADYARISGLKVKYYDLLFYVLLSLTIVGGVKLVGVVLINALLVIPASISKMFSKSITQMFLYTPLLSVFICLVGMLVAFGFDLPTGPAIAVFGGVVFGSALGIKWVWRI